MTHAIERRHESDSADLPRLMVIGGSKVAAASGRRFATVDPASGHAISEVPAGGAADVDRAVAAAKAALRGD
jgi:phenylacetaldehyde dehydrogenase